MLTPLGKREMTMIDLNKCPKSLNGCTLITLSIKYKKNSKLSNLLIAYWVALFCYLNFFIKFLFCVSYY